MMANILVVEDDDVTAHDIVATLHSHSHRVDRSAYGAEALERSAHQAYDLITLDRMLPDMDGLAVVERLRRERIFVPVLMISALSDVDDRITGLRAGGDDYMTKPFSSSEMATRVEVLLRRQRQLTNENSLLTAGPLTIDLIQRRVTLNGETIRLLPMEFKLLEFLARNAGNTVSRRIIFERVWGYYFDPGDNLISVHIARLRKKLERPGCLPMITTVKGEGYRLHAD